MNFINFVSVSSFSTNAHHESHKQKIDFRDNRGMRTKTRTSHGTLLYRPTVRAIAVY